VIANYMHMLGLSAKVDEASGLPDITHTAWLFPIVNTEGGIITK